MGGFGTGPWGATPWGGGTAGDGLELVDARAVAENLVRLQFNLPPRFSGLFDAGDASSTSRYVVTPQAGTTGGDGQPCRPVSPAAVALALFAGAGGAFVDVTVDRPFSPWPAAYVVAVNGLVAAGSGSALVPGAATLPFPGLRAGPTPALPDLALGRTDFANPQGPSALAGLPPTTALGSFPVDSTGDYATDAGLAGYRKRVMRRLMTKRGRFAHLPNYGVGLPGNVKKLARPALREAIAADAEAQVKLEPETSRVTVTVVDGAAPGLFRLVVQADTVDGQSFEMQLPFSLGGV